MRGIERREFFKRVLAALPILKLDWESFPRAGASGTEDKDCDAIIIGSGLGGLSCAAAFARQGFKSIVLEQHNQPGGYATAFSRRGGFTFDVSLHSTTVGEREGIRNLIQGFPEIKEVEFVPHPYLYRAVFPEHDIRVPQQDIQKYMDLLIKQFPSEKEGIIGLFNDMKGLANEIDKYSQLGGKVDMDRFPQEFPVLYKSFAKTWGGFLDPWIKDVRLKAIVSALWGYYGLPPSKLACFYYVLPTIGYLSQGGFYPRGRSQAVSQAFVKFIEERGGQVLLSTCVDKILVKDKTAYGVVTDKGREITARVVVSNANAYDTFHSMVEDPAALADYLARLGKYSVSLSTFQVFLGLKKDLAAEAGIKDSEIFVESGYDPEESYAQAAAANVEGGGYGLTIYDNVYQGYSPQGKNTINILVLQGYDHWEKYEADYWKGNKAEYKKEKERMADLLIEKAERGFLPGLRNAIEVKEIGTPLTNVRYTRNYRGAAYGWDQTLDNSGPRRLPHKTPIKNLYLSGAWTSPGHGYGAVIPSGLECFAEIMKEW
ncbi:MAG: NAD(P)/FAD-dependent oxidoreductase [Candidatus Aminicenantales bacterium]